MTEHIQVSGKGFAYQVTIGPGLLQQPEQFAGLQATDGVLIVSNDVVAELYLPTLQQSLQTAGIDCHACIVSDGEHHKTIATWQSIVDHLVRMRANRKTVVMALGGGVVGDMAGFAAASYMRGIRVVQLPTTLLAQVDAAIGGKTGVNLPSGKNLVGAFHQPSMVVMDSDTLHTLPEREYRAGLAEVVKYAMIMDAGFFAWLEQHADALLQRHAQSLTAMIGTCVRHKAEVVAADTLEQGRRALLNYGHTFAHALESQTAYTQWLHGEAVAIGMHLAASFSHQAGDINAEVVNRQLQLLLRFGFDLSLPAGLQAEALANAMLLDKKADQRGITLVLPRAIGAAVISPDHDCASLVKHFQYHLQAAPRHGADVNAECSQPDPSRAPPQHSSHQEDENHDH